MGQRPPPLDPNEPAVLDRVRVRLLTAGERARWDELIRTQHYLHNAGLVGEQLRYVAEVDGQWVALLGWSAASYHLRAREAWIGWSLEQRRARLQFVANNARFLILEPGRWPNLASRVLKLCGDRLPGDWQSAYGHTILLVESFVDSQLFRGTAYKANGWEALGQTAGFQRVAEDFYVPHERPKQLWVKALLPPARAWLRAAVLPEPLAAQEKILVARCRTPPPALGSLWEQLHRQLPEPRSPHGLRHKQATVLSLVLCALGCGVRGGYRQLEAFAQEFNQAQRRRLRCWRQPRTARYEVPDESTFARVLETVAPCQLTALLLRWQNGRLGPAEGSLLGLDGKSVRHGGQHHLGAVDLQNGRTLALASVEKKTNEIPVAQKLLADWRLDGKVAVLDALHTQLETARTVVQAAGGDYLFTIKANQKTLLATAQSLLPEALPPYACGDRNQSQPHRAAGDHRAHDQRRTTGLSPCRATGQARTPRHPARRSAHGGSGLAGDQPRGAAGQRRSVAGLDPRLLGH